VVHLRDIIVSKVVSVFTSYPEATNVTKISSIIRPSHPLLTYFQLFVAKAKFSDGLAIF